MNGPPTTLGQYQIIREIARSNDIVYEAYDPLMNRRVAVKELAVPGGSTPQQKDERISRFKREAQAAGTLNHPNIMTVFSFAEDAGRTFMAMEYLDGVTLRNEIDTKGFVPAERAVDVATQVLEGLSHAHSKGVIHRDIKPDNVQLLTSGTVKITDFGIARLTFQPNLTMDGQVFGTPSYMSPEQVVGKDIDARSDLFSVGVLLYEMLSGTKPFSGDSVVSITYAIMNTEPTKPQQCSEAMWTIIRKAIDKSPMLRYNSALDMLAGLKEAYAADVSGTGMNQMFNLGQQQQSTYQPYQPQNIQQQPTYVYNPYTNQSMPVPQQQQNLQTPPIQTPYLPQQQQPQQQTYGYNQAPYNPGAYLPQGSMPPPGFPPVYYPPPPRQPLMKPETADFLRRLVIALIIMGTLFAVILVGLNMLVAAFQNYQAVQQDGQITTVDDPRMSLEERISKMEQQKAQFHSLEKRDEQDRKIAVLLAQLGQQALKNGATVDAEKLFGDAIAKDKNNPAHYTNLASLYESQAKRLQNDPSLWSLAARNWQGAWATEVDPARKNNYGDGAATGYYMYARLVIQGADMESSRAARDALYEARSTASAGSEIYYRVTEFLAELQRR